MATSNVLERGMMLRDLPAHTLDGRAVQVYDFRGRRNLVLIFTGADREEALLSALRASAADLKEEEAAVLIADPTGDLRRYYGAVDHSALYITDRYGEIFFVAQAPARALPGVKEILEWLRFINAQCPE